MVRAVVRGERGRWRLAARLRGRRRADDRRGRGAERCRANGPGFERLRRPDSESVQNFESNDIHFALFVSIFTVTVIPKARVTVGRLL